MESHAEMFAEATHFMPEPSEFKIGPDQYFEGIRRAKAAVKIPVIGSLNGTSLGGWLGYGRATEEVGADALELNIFDVPMNERVSGADIESALRWIFDVSRFVENLVESRQPETLLKSKQRSGK